MFINEIDTKDTQFSESVIEAVTVHSGSDGYELRHDGGWVIWCPAVPEHPIPAAGETLRLYGRGIGYTVRGIVVGGRVYKYLTEEQERAQREIERREAGERREKEFADNLAETDRRIAALPELFRKRIEKFQIDGGVKFRVQFEPYELFCCEQAVVIANAFKTREEVIEFSKLAWADQKRRVPELAEGHSGNTFAFACLLAGFYLGQPDLVVKMHGSMTPLVGCDEFGCKHDEQAS
jgi:hypothetical protein